MPQSAPSDEPLTLARKWRELDAADFKLYGGDPFAAVRGHRYGLLQEWTALEDSYWYSVRVVPPERPNLAPMAGEDLFVAVLCAYLLALMSGRAVN